MAEDVSLPDTGGTVVGPVVVAVAVTPAAPLALDDAADEAVRAEATTA